MKKILFDLSVCQPYQNTKFHGGGVYGYIVFKALAGKYPQDILAYYDDKRFLPDDVRELIARNGITVRKASEQTIAELYSQSEFERLYTPLWREEYSALAKYGVPLTVTEHGLRNL
ncbi:MAG: glycosyl transferase family 1, partial [Duncaniella sp.]|nr:glycosyl transferase family 1 [Duncaniella sp.]